MISFSKQIALCTLFFLQNQEVEAAIETDGLWTGNDWYDSANNMGVSNGVVYSNDDAVNGRLAAARTKDGPVSNNYASQANVQRVQSVFSQAQWDEGFPHADSIYTYTNFLKAVAKYPSFCNETNLSMSVDDTCRRELSTLFAHWGQETGKRDPNNGEFWTQGLYHIEEMRCKGTSDPSCDYKDWGWSNNAWPNQTGHQYYGRGPMQLSWNYNYGQFSNVFGWSSYNSKMELLENPERLNTEGDLAMSAGLWFYMTPQSPKPSMHDVMTGYYSPNSVDTANNFGNNFATTTNIINGGLECGKGLGSPKVVDRGNYFNHWLNFFGLSPESNLDCGNQPNAFPAGGAGTIFAYLDQDWSGTKCKLVGWMTQYSVFARDDYKRCICDKYAAGAEEAACP